MTPFDFFAPRRPAPPALLPGLLLALLGGAAAPRPAAAQAVLTNQGGTLFVAPGGTLQVNGDYAQTAGALLGTAGTAAVAGSVSGAAGSALDLAAGQLSATGDVQHLGSTAGTTGTLRLTGAAAQTLTTAGGTLPNLTIAKPGGTATLSGPVQVRRELTLADAGNLALNGQPLTLLSDAAGTALVVNAGTGVVTGGTATMQRYLDTANPGLGYRHYASPVSGNTLADLATATFTPVFDPAYNSRATPHPAQGFPTVFGYDQGRLAGAPSPYQGFDRGWFSPLATDAMGPATGYAVNLPGTELVDFTGTLRTGDYARTLPRAAGSAGGEGLHLVGNPYPAPIDWNLVTPADRPGLDAAFYVFESTSQYGGTYRTAVNGIGASTFIGSSQGFFVRVTPGQAAGTLTFRNAHRLTDYAQQAPVRRGPADARPLVQLTLTGAGRADAFYAYAEAGATAGTDAAYDAAKLANPSGLNLGSAAATGEALAIDGRPAFAAGTVIPLRVTAPAAGAYACTAEVAHLPAGLAAYLVDNATGARTRLGSGTAYAFGLSAAEAAAPVAGRFALAFGPAGAALATGGGAAVPALALYPNPATGFVTLTGAAPHAAVRVLDALGRLVLAATADAAGTARLALPVGLATGVYTVQSGAAARRLTVE